MSQLTARPQRSKQNQPDICNRQIDASRPSFAYKIRESRNSWRLARQLKAVTPLHAVDHKLNGASFADALGVRPPLILAGPSPISELTPPQCGSFVLKPVRGTSGRGVLLLNREEGGFRDILSGTLYQTWAAACAVSKRAVEKNKEFYVEELVGRKFGQTGCPDDFKFYCFYGVVGLILQKRRINNKISHYKWLNGLWENVNTGRYVDMIDESMPLPEHMDNLLVSAKLLSSSIPAPFLRIDLYDGSEGAVFGEFTPHPGGYDTFSKKWDTALGAMYEEASTRLQIDLVHGRFDLGAFWSRLGYI